MFNGTYLKEGGGGEEEEGKCMMRRFMTALLLYISLSSNGFYMHFILL